MGGGRERCCCGVPGCVIFQDNFDRANSTNLGSDWTEVVGDSEIAGNTVQIPDLGLIKCNTPHPIDTPTCVVFADIANDPPSGKYRVLVNYVDEDNYLFGQYDSAGTLSVGEVAAGVETILDSVACGGIVFGDVLTVCRNKGGLYAGVGIASVWAWHCVADNGGRYTGLASGSGQIKFDDFYFEEHYVTDPDCKQCECHCNEFCVPKTLYLTFSASDCCEDLDERTIELTFDAGAYPEFQWTGSDDLPVWDDCVNPGTDTYSFILYCTPDESQWRLGGAFTCSPAGPDLPRMPDIVYCNPLYLEYHDFYCYGSPPPDPPPECHIEKIIITE